MNDARRYIKYPLYLFSVLVIAKFLYIIIESYYNYDILLVTTSANLSEDILNSLNERGHLISSAGITLLVIPFLYYLVKKQKEKIVYAILLIGSVIIFAFTYNMLNKIVDNIVASNKDKRHDAYYLNLFKYGLLNNIFSYNSFIDNNKIKNNKIDINDRILLTNTFLLLYADEKLIKKLKKRGLEKASEIYISKYAKDDYEKNFQKFEKIYREIIDSYNQFNESKKLLLSKLNDIKKLRNDKVAKKEYKKFISQLRTNYKTYLKNYDKNHQKYKKAIKSVNKKIEEETQYSKIEDIYKKLNYYFEHRSSSRVQAEYKKTMNKKFGHYIEPSRWLNSYDEVSLYTIKEVIESEIRSKIPKEFPKKLSYNEFIESKEVRKKVKNNLAQKGISVSLYGFDYREITFKKLFYNMLTKKHNQALKTFYKELNNKLGKNDLNLSTTWKSFVRSKYVTNQIKTKINIENNKDLKTILKVILSDSNNLKENFTKLLYLPKVQDKIYNIMYKKNDFLDNHKAAKIGDEAIKLLYIPPFALAVSIMALLLNLITLAGLIASTKLPNKAVWFIKISILVLLITLPFLDKYNSLDNKMINKVSAKELTVYISFLNWISYYEDMNSKWH